MFNYAAAAHVYANGSSEVDRPALLRLEGFPKENDFHPIGADIVPAAQRKDDDGASGPHRLFVINHAGRWSTIELFDLYTASSASGWYARYVRSIDHPSAAHQPNALVALSSNEFLVTQDHLFRFAPGRSVSFVRSTPWYMVSQRQACWLQSPPFVASPSC